MQRADEIIHLVADPGVAEALIAGLKPGKEFMLQVSREEKPPCREPQRG